MIHTFESLSAKAAPVGDCLVWQGAKAGKGYGVVKDDRERYVHRLVLLLDGRPLSPGQQAAHSCGNYACINPAHLRAATQAENERDKALHGRDRRGKAGVTHCGKYLADGARCKRKPHDGRCEED